MITLKTLRTRVNHALSTLVLFALASLPTAAWNATGHMAVADIAYDHLTPNKKAAVDTLLMRHRDYALWMSQMPAGYTDRARFAFMKAASWPDDIGKTPDNHPLWHDVDLPVVAPGYAAAPAQFQPVKPSILTQLPIEEALVSNKTAADGDRAVALCWVEHLIGDLHQPLHDASLFSAQFPQGDQGGDSDRLAAGAVTADPIEARANPHNLHALWDDLEGDSLDPTDVIKIAARLETPLFGRATYPQIALHRHADDWAQEGNALARDVVYQGGKIVLTPDGEQADVTLPPGYLDTAHKVADRQIALAGLRLADFINATEFPPTSTVPSPVVPALLTAVPSARSKAQDVPSEQPIIGNTWTREYRVGDDGQQPEEGTLIFFQTEEEAQKAGYHKSGGL